MALVLHRLAPGPEDLPRSPLVHLQVQQSVLHDRLNLTIYLLRSSAASSGLPEITFWLGAPDERTLDRLALAIDAPADTDVLQTLHRFPRTAVGIALGQERGLLEPLRPLQVLFAQPLALRQHGAHGVAYQPAGKIVVAESALVLLPALVAFRIEEPSLGLVEARARIARYSSRWHEAHLARFRTAYRVLVQRRQLALVRRRAMVAVRTAGGDRAVQIEQRRAVRARIVLLRQANGHGRTRRRATRHLDHSARLVLATARHAAARIAARARRTAGVRVQLEAVRAIELAVNIRASRRRITARHGSFENSGARCFLALLIHAPAHAIVTLIRLERAVGVASGYVDSSSWLARFSGGVFGDRAGVLARRGHDGRHALRAAAGRATLVSGRALLIVATLQFAAGRARHEVRALARLGRQARRYRRTVLIRTAIHVDHRAGLLRVANDVAAWLVATTLLATGRVHLIAVRTDQVAIEMLADSRELFDGVTIGRAGGVHSGLQDHPAMVHAVAIRAVATLQRLEAAILLALRRRDRQRHSLPRTLHAIVEISQILAH